MCTAKTLQDLKDLEEMKQEIDKQIKALKAEILKEYGTEKTTVKVENFTININLVTRCNLDTTKLKREHPSIFELYKRESVYNTIKIKG